VVFCPEHAQMLAGAGYGKNGLRGIARFADADTTPRACADCLVPQDMMRGILGQALGVPRDAIDLTYPSTSD
jgi:hypothetical protein